MSGVSLQLVASNDVLHDRRRNIRGVLADPWTTGRALEFLAVGAIAASLAITIWAMTEFALVWPLARLGAVLDGQATRFGWR